MQDSKFVCLFFVSVEKQRSRDASFSEGEMILISQFFAVGSPRDPRADTVVSVSWLMDLKYFPVLKQNLVQTSEYIQFYHTMH